MSRKFFTTRVMILLIVLILMIIAINPNPFATGIEVQTVKGEIAEQGLRIGDNIESINGKQIDNVEEFNLLIDSEYREDKTFVIKTNKREIAYIATEKPTVTVKEARSNNLDVGLDLSGGTRVLLEPDTDEVVSNKQIEDLIDVLNNRLNTYGLSDLQIRAAEDRDGKQLVLVEIAGASRQEVRELIEQQGQFEAKIGERVVFVGSEKDIPFVCKDDGTCSGIRSCDQNGDGYSCRFEFQISLSAEAAKRHAEITMDIPINVSDIGTGGAYLAEPLDLYLDGELVDSLRISENLKGQEATAITISGPGGGATEEVAYDDALKQMNRLQTIMITGSLPFSLNIVKIDSISPILGSNFIYNAFLVGLLAILGVVIVIFIRYRKFKIVLPFVVNIISEIIIVLGIAALINWRLDLVSIAGIIAAVGTGVDDQIVITDEVLKGEGVIYNWKERTKRAFFIIFAAYAATVAAMIPLWSAGAGLMRGFAVTTIIGVTVGVFITRPAFASMVEKLFRE